MCGGTLPIQHHGMAAEQCPLRVAIPVRVFLEVDLDVEPVRGSLTNEDGSVQTFVGWLGLTVALDRLRARSEG